MCLRSTKHNNKHCKFEYIFLPLDSFCFLFAVRTDVFYLCGMLFSAFGCPFLCAPLVLVFIIIAYIIQLPLVGILYDLEMLHLKAF